MDSRPGALERVRGPEALVDTRGQLGVSHAGRLRRRVLGISERETSFARRGFRPTAPERQARLERIGRSFVAGFNAALEIPDADLLGRRLPAIEREQQGFAFEGAAMALAVLDILHARLLPFRTGPDRLTAFLERHGERHTYMIHVGAGWAAARLRVPLARYVERFEPLRRWLVADGFGFHQGYFDWRRTIAARVPVRRPDAYGGRAFDQGLGRSLWFVEGANVDAIVERVLSFPPPRRPDLWSGVGLAAAYAGGAEPAELDRLAAAAGEARPHMAQGAAFAAKARIQADLPAPHTEIACRHLCGVSMADAARWTDDALRDTWTSRDGADTARSGDANTRRSGGVDAARSDGANEGANAVTYELWRARVRSLYLDSGNSFQAVSQ